MPKQHPRNDIIDKYADLYKGDYGRALNPSFKLVTNALPRFKKSGVESVLDVGCGRGRLLDLLEDHGFRVSGTEVIKCLIENDLKQWNVYSVEAHHFASQVGQHDLVVCIDVLDHLVNEEEAVTALRELFKAAKIAILVVVNSESKQRTLKCSDTWWIGHISSIDPQSRVELDKRIGRGSRIIVWKSNVHRPHSKTQLGPKDTS